MTKVDSLNFGSIAVDGREYDYDVVVLPDGTVKGREATREIFGSHSIIKVEIEALVYAKPDVIIVGTGISGAARVASEAATYARENNIELIVLPSNEAIDRLNWLVDEGKRVAALIHITC